MRQCFIINVLYLHLCNLSEVIINYWCPQKKCANVISQLLSHSYISMLIIGLVIAHCVSRAKGSENQIEPAIRNGEQCEIGCSESANLLLWNRLLTSFRERVPYRQAHTTRSLVGLLCLTETWFTKLASNDWLGSLADNNSKK